MNFSIQSKIVGILILLASFTSNASSSNPTTWSCDGTPSFQVTIKQGSFFSSGSIKIVDQDGNVSNFDLAKLSYGRCDLNSFGTNCYNFYENTSLIHGTYRLITVSAGIIEGNATSGRVHAGNGNDRWSYLVDGNCALQND